MTDQEFIDNLSDLLRTQDNSGTNEPMYLVKETDVSSNPRYAFFTRKAAEEFVIRNRHELDNPYIYVASGWENEERTRLRKILMTRKLKVI